MINLPIMLSINHFIIVKNAVSQSPGVHYHIKQRKAENSHQNSDQLFID